MNEEWIKREISQLEREIRKNRIENSRKERESKMKKLKLSTMLLFLCVSMSMSSCMYNITILQPKSETTDLIDKEKSDDSEILDSFDFDDEN